MRLRILAVGKLRSRGLEQHVGEYAQRICRHMNFEVAEVKDDRALLRAYQSGDYNVALEVTGREMSSRQLAAGLEGWLTRKSRVTFIIGGAEGLPSEIRRGADEQLSLSRLTLPHRIARLLLSEQLYRATCIWRGEPYAKED